MRYIYYAIIISLIFAGCSSPTPKTTEDSVVLTEHKLDSIFEYYEDQAYNRPENYIHNPDDFFAQIKQVPQTDYQKELYTYTLIFVGYSLLQHGDIFSSIQYYEKALNYVRSANMSIDDEDDSIIKPLANLYIRISDVDKAIALLESTIASSPAGKDITGLYNNLANAYLFRDEFGKAKNTLLYALNKPTTSLSKALLHNSLSSVYKEENNSPESAHHNRLAIDEFEKNNLSADTLLWYISALGLKSELLQNSLYIRKAIQLANEHFPKTQQRFKAKLFLIQADLTADDDLKLQYYQHVLNYFSKENNKYVEDYTFTKALVGMAKLFHQKNQIDTALTYYEWAIENDFKTQQLIVSAENQLRNNLLNKEILESLISMFTENNLLKSSQESVELLLWCIELSKARLLVNEINRSDQWSSSDAALKKAIQEIRWLYQKIDITKDQTVKEQLQDKISALIHEFQLSERYFEKLNLEPNKSNFLNKLNETNTSYYAYYIHKDSTISIIHKTRNQISYRKENDQSLIPTLEKFKENYFGATPNNFNTNPNRYYKLAKDFKNSLLPDLSHSNKNIYISLDGSLYGLPFDALWDNDFLVRKYNFAYLNSFILFDFLKSEKTNRTDISILYRTEYPKPFPNLDFVSKEIESISSTFKTEKIPPLEQTDATLKDQFAKSNIIHIAAHTILDSTAAPLIYLNHEISTNQLRFFEIKTPLVFLSACNTGSGQSLPSEGTESIQRVFLSKNVPSVISTYWFANDEAMLQLTSDFYKELNSSNNPIQALANSKRMFLDQAETQQQNPWYWANINYTGVGNKIGLKKSSNLLIITSCLAIVLFGFLYWKVKT